MLKATPEQRRQIDTFFTIITEHYENILLHPVIDEKNGMERLAICVMGEDDNIYMLGLWFLPDDPLFNRFSRKEDVSKIINKKPRRILDCFKKMTRRVYHLFS